MNKLGLDLGTKHIVLSWRDGGAVKTRYEVNGYMSIDRVDSFTEQLLQKSQVPYVTRGNEFIAIGARAEQLAYSFNKTLKRPMAGGGVSKSDDDAQEIMAIIIKSIIGKLDEDAIIYYCTTAKPLNSTMLNIDFHKKVVKLMVESYGSSKIKAYHINEARCLTLEEPGVAIGVSWGAGTVTVHAGMFGVPIFEFSLIGAGDWIDIEAAKRFGFDPDHPNSESRETPTTICRRKEKIDLSKKPENNVDQAIVLMYEILIENIVNGILRGFNDNQDKFRADTPVPIINAGGTCMPHGFIEIFKKKVNDIKDKFVIPVGEITKAKDPLFAVAHGCLRAAELHKDQ